MIKYILPAILLSFGCHQTIAQKKGCTDPQALNYDSAAKINDGTCTYAATAYLPKAVCPKLSDTMAESSGLIWYNNYFWTHNDSGNEPAIYAFDSTKGTIIHRTFIGNKTNIDWEEITQDANNIYIGEFGNNNGDRKDLKIYILKKSDIKMNRKSDTVTVSEIQFSYTDQISFTSASQNHNFDMEAMCVWQDSLHLFSKDWVDNKTRHYVLPLVPGIYSISPRETLAAGCLITSACTNAAGDKIILGGYSTSNGGCFMWMLWDFTSSNFFSGNKRQINIGSALTIGQYEGTAFKGNQIYITNEKKFTNAALWRMEIGQYFSSMKTIKASKFIVYQKGNELMIETKSSSGTIYIYNATGVKVITHKIKQSHTALSIEQLSTGVYSVEVNGVVQKVVIER